MSNPRVLPVPPDGAGRRHLRLPILSAADVADLGFDFSQWVAEAPGDAINACAGALAAPSGVTYGAAVLAGAVVTVRVGPAIPATCWLFVTVQTTQGRRKTASAILAIIPPATDCT